MLPTYIGGIVSVFGLIILIKGDITSMLILMLVCALFGGSAALSLPALGGASIPPVQLALLFGLARIFLPGSELLPEAGKAIRANMFLGLYAIYGLALAMLAPRFFAGLIDVVPLRYNGRMGGLLDFSPIQFASANITTPVYMMGSFLAGVVGYVAMKGSNAPIRLVKAGVIVAWIHIFFGLSAAILKGTPYDLFIAAIRNANYFQTEQTIMGVARITGVFPEPSSYASFGFGWFVFLFECWFRNILPRRTGPVVLVLGMVLFFSSSTTAYVALAAYSLILLLRIIFIPSCLDIRKGLALGIFGGATFLLVTMLSFIFPTQAAIGLDLLKHLTIDKQQSESGVQRSFWAALEIKAFFASHGIGIGPGSSRSSGLWPAMIGSVGVVGCLLFIPHFLRVLKPLRPSTYCGAGTGWRYGQTVLIGAAAGWGAFGVLLPLSVTSSSCDLGNDFCVLAGVALALRQGASSRQRDASEQAPLVALDARPVSTAREPLSGGTGRLRFRNFHGIA